jgi:LuxR family transcriptional regulator
LALKETAVKTIERIDSEVAKLEVLAPAGYFLAIRVRGASPLMVFKTFPADWLDIYMENGYMMRDPITTWALTVGGTIRWSSSFLPDPFGVLRHAAEHGLKYGASIAHGPRSALTLCSICRQDREPTKDEIAAAREIVLRLHDLTELPKSLSDSQRAGLNALASGSGAAGLARELGISQAAAAAEIRDLYDVLFAASPDDALRRARDAKLV